MESDWPGATLGSALLCLHVGGWVRVAAATVKTSLSFSVLIYQVGSHTCSAPPLGCTEGYME